MRSLTQTSLHPDNTLPLSPGTYVVSLTASNGAGPVVAMAVIDVDMPVAGLQIKFSPEDPAIDEGMIFVVSSTDASHGLDVSNSAAKCYSFIVTSSS